MEESEPCRDDFRWGEAGRGVVVSEGNVGTASTMDGDSGSIVFFSLIDMTILSSLSDVMCFSRPLLLVVLSIEDFLGDGRTMSSGNTWGGWRASAGSASSEAIESTLADSSGTSLEPGRAWSYSVMTSGVYCGFDSQQKVSRFHNLQLRFSNRRPSSIDSAHLEKTGVAC